MSVSPSLAEVIIDALAQRGVERLFGVPGGGSSLALMAAADARDIDFVLTRTETAAAIMAAVTGELSGAPGVVLTGVGPGAASAVNGIAYASLERSPVLLFTDGPAASLHQAFDQNALFAPVTKQQGRLRASDGAARIEEAIDSALAAPQGPVQLDLTAADAAAPVPVAGPLPLPPAAAETDRASLDRARGLLAESRRPVFLIGLEARRRVNCDAIRAWLGDLTAPLLSTYKAKGVVPEERTVCVGVLTGAQAEADCLAQADLIVSLGLDPIELIPGNWPYGAPILDLREAASPEPPGAAACRLIGPLGRDSGGSGPARDGGDLERRGNRSVARCDGRSSGIDGRGDHRRGRGFGSVPQGAGRLSPHGRRWCPYVLGSGAMARGGALRRPQIQWALDHGFALPAAIASALQEPDRPVVAVTGDGGLMMCLAELATAVEAGCRLVVVVLNDAALSLIDIKQQRQQQACFGVRTRQFDFAAAAQALGCQGWRVEAPIDVSRTLDEAFALGGPALVDVTVDPRGYLDQLTALRG